MPVQESIIDKQYTLWIILTVLNNKQKATKIMNLGVELIEIKDGDMLLVRILHEARELVNADAGSLLIKENDKLKLSYTQNETQVKRFSPGKKLIYSKFSIPVNNHAIAGYVVITGDYLIIPDSCNRRSAHPKSFSRHYDDISGCRTKSMLTFPLKTNSGETIGVLQLINSKNTRDKVDPFSK
jgi:GAF domain